MAWKNCNGFLYILRDFKRLENMARNSKYFNYFKGILKISKGLESLKIFCTESQGF